MVEDIVWVRRVAGSGAARAIREGAGISLGEIAREIGVSQAAVSRWERGLRRPRGPAAERYADLLRRLAA